MMTNNQSRNSRLLSWLKNIWQKLVYRWGNWHERRALLEMDDHLLKDIGLSRADVQRMAGGRWQRAEPLTPQQYMKLDELQLLAFYKIRNERTLGKIAAENCKARCGKGKISHTTEPGC